MKFSNEQKVACRRLAGTCVDPILASGDTAFALKTVKAALEAEFDRRGEAFWAANGLTKENYVRHNLKDAGLPEDIPIVDVDDVKRRVAARARVEREAREQFKRNPEPWKELDYTEESFAAEVVRHSAPAAPTQDELDALEGVQTHAPASTAVPLDGNGLRLKLAAQRERIAADVREMRAAVPVLTVEKITTMLEQAPNDEERARIKASFLSHAGRFART